MHPLKRAALTLVILLGNSALAATIHGQPLFVVLKDDPDSNTAFLLLLKVAVAGAFVQFFHLLSRTGRDPSMPWQRWIGESLLGGVTAFLAAGGAYTLGPPTTQLKLALIGVIGGYIGQRAILWAVNAWAKSRNLPALPGGDRDA